jgi:Mn-dependent DtxR family transcriptional regulator
MRPMTRAGEAVPDQRQLLVKLAELGTTNVPTLAGALGAWNNQDAVAEILGDLAALQLIEPGPSGAWRLTDKGAAAARRSRA